MKLGKWNIGLKYEFMTSLNLENKTKKAEVRAMGTAMGDEGNPLADYKDGVNTPSDIPALLTAAVGYEFLLRFVQRWNITIFLIKRQGWPMISRKR